VAPTADVFRPVEGRGGPQLIPRPDSARPGPRPAWDGVEPGPLPLGQVVARLRAAGPPRHSPFEPPAGQHRSAVLVPLFEEGGDTWIVLTRRAQHLRAHKGEVAFPGGRQDDGEALVDTAKREAWEEIRLDPDAVDVVGELDHLATVSSGSSIVPYVGVLPGRPVALVASPDEVEAVITVRLGELVDPVCYRVELWPWEGAERPMHFFDLVGDTIWGATGRMLANLLEIALGLDDRSG
jgi:8-oxo-dGTP pyrophosphatase MutT (NUDIX family)